MISVTRRYAFSASHRLHSPSLSSSDNARIYGKCNNPFGHGHDYTLEVTAAGEVDARTGLLLPVRRLDQLVEKQVLRRISHRNLNADVPYFASRVPTTENLALMVANLLRQNWETHFPGMTVWLKRVHIQETGRNSFQVLLPRLKRVSGEQESECVALNE